MKKLFLCTIWFYWATAIFIPNIYTLFIGYSNTFSFGSGLDNIDDVYKLEATLIFTIAVIFITVFLKRGRIDAILEPINSLQDDIYFELITVFFIILILIIGKGSLSSYQRSVLQGGLSGSLFNYATFFFDIQTLFLARILSKARNKNIIPIVLYVAYTICIGSRSGLMFLVLFEVCDIFSGGKNKQKKLKYLLILVLLSPFAFLISTAIRGVEIKNVKFLIDSIIGRCSILEILGRVLQGVHTSNYNVDLFERKYSIINQAQGAINSLLPGSIFPEDNMPNTYFRAIFSNYDEEFVRRNYMSINMTPIGYFSLKYSVPLSIVFVVLLVVFFFKVCKRNKNKLLFRVFAVMGLWEILYFFDWNMILIRFLKITMTLLTYFAYLSLRKKIRPFIRYII